MKPRTAVVFATIIVYFTARYAYYGTLIPHAYSAKQLMPYYHSNPMGIINLWTLFAIAVPILAATGAYYEKRFRLMTAYVVLSSMPCLLGLTSDWGRYTAHLFPLMIILGTPILKSKPLTYVILGIMMVQGVYSIEWMRNNAKQVAKVQVARGNIGRWVESNIDHSQWVLSGDIGEIAYVAKDCKFIDSNGLTSADVLDEYLAGRTIDRILIDKNPKYIADTFTTVNGKYIYKYKIEVRNPVVARPDSTYAIIAGELW
jgi:hypothetical protein